MTIRHLIWGIVWIQTSVLARSIDLTADDLKYNDKTKQTTAIGSARAVLTMPKQPDKVLTAHRIDIFHTAKGTSQKGEEDFDQIHATQNVIFESEKALIYADQCVYDRSSKNLECHGRVSLRDKKTNDVVTGDHGFYDDSTQEIRVTKDPNGQKVKLTMTRE